MCHDHNVNKVLYCFFYCYKKQLHKNQKSNSNHNKNNNKKLQQKQSSAVWSEPLLVAWVFYDC